MSGPERDRDLSCAEPPAPLTATATASPAINDPSLSASPEAAAAALAPRPAESPEQEQQQQQQQHHHNHGVDGSNGSGLVDVHDGSSTHNVDNNNNNNADDDDGHDAGQAAASANLPPFEPIFTLLTNNTTNTTVHPRVHYLFSDDDASAVLVPPQTDPLHRALVVDLAPPAAPNGKWTVSWASSLTPDFAVTASQLSLQQHGTDAEAGSTSVVLRVEGVEREAVGSRPNSLPNSGSGVVGRENVEQLTDEFRRRMGVLKKVVDEGERRRDALGMLNEGGVAHLDHGEDVAPGQEDASAPEGQDG